MPTLYYAVGACSLAPHVALEWIGAPYEAVRVQYGAKLDLDTGFGKHVLGQRLTGTYVALSTTGAVQDG